MAHLGISLDQRFPLRDIPQNILDDICRGLWGWTDCLKCINKGHCPKSQCPWATRSSLNSFRTFYRELTFRHTPEDWYGSLPALKSHADLLELVGFIQDHPCSPRKELVARYYNRGESLQLTGANRCQAFDLALSILSMIPYAERNRHLDQSSIVAPETWRDHQSACDAIEKAIVPGTLLNKREMCVVAQGLSATKLLECGLSISGTDDLRQHLEYDAGTRSVYVFHHAGFLRGHLLSVRARHNTADRLVFQEST